MKKIIKGKSCDTESAKLIGTRCEGNFGDANGYEEQLFITKTSQYFFHGVGGPESKYPKETIVLVANGEAEEWKKANIQE